MMNRRQMLAAAGVTAGGLWAAGAVRVFFGGRDGPGILNVSYDATRDLFTLINRAFVAQYSANHQQPVRVTPSHGGSGSQARAVIDGLPADVVTLALRPDTQQIADRGLIQPGWIDRFPNRSLPYTSTIVFLVRKGNPHVIRGWADLPDKDVRIVAANPKTSGSAKLAFVAGWGVAHQTWGESSTDADAFIQRLYRRVPALDSSSRAATVTFVRKAIGDVLLTWESEAFLALRESPNDVEIVWPRDGSILAEPHVAMVDLIVDRNGTRELAQEYLEYLYHPDAKSLICAEGYRPFEPERMNASAIAQYHRQFDSLPGTELLTIEGLFPSGGWSEIQSRFFANGALFDRIYTAM